MLNVPSGEVAGAVQAPLGPVGTGQSVLPPVTVQLPMGRDGTAQSVIAPANAISCGVQGRVSSSGAWPHHPVFGPERALGVTAEYKTVALPVQVAARLTL